MPISTHQAIYLGTYADADTDELTFPVENTGVYLNSFGSSGDPLHDHVVDIDFDDWDSTGEVATDNTATLDTISHSAGGFPVITTVDSLAVVSLTVTYTNGDTANFTNAVMFQDSNGNLFLTNSNFAGTDITSGSSAYIESVTVTTVDTNYTGLFHTNLQAFPCFASGTRIATPNGPLPVEEVKVGDRVTTASGTERQVIWRASRHLVFSDGDLSQKPIEIKPGAMGRGFPQNRLVLSPQHGVMLPATTQSPAALVAAKHLTPLPGFRQMRGARSVTYHSILCDQHDILLAEGLPVESFFPGRYALSLLPLGQRLAVGAAIRDLAYDPATTCQRPALSRLSRKEAWSRVQIRRASRRFYPSTDPAVNYILARRA
ncbi:hypothetical protein TRP8649_04342 [Pelagimonas phthalicica]|uniref:Hedgehog/Intein (Hint) domain-containing protein n=1 Tax=Pelagimonas phthalicica TaxID=1037362 RepID=A0A238JHQ6_9RHOB|nr:Hint domain-containing protein [Pelagimonas phthalicica]TDS90032.1 Hint domain-containing protein [Pelagimonas phthalicica]SMX30200.1 hypothetical protein TRP8649_04342 [Pelagimonas phthalicica]